MSTGKVGILPRELLVVRRLRLKLHCLPIRDMHHRRLLLIFPSSMTQMLVHHRLSHIPPHKDNLAILLALVIQGHPRLRQIIALSLLRRKHTLPKARFEKAAMLGKRLKTFSKPSILDNCFKFPTRMERQYIQIPRQCHPRYLPVPTRHRRHSIVK